MKMARNGNGKLNIGEASEVLSEKASSESGNTRLDVVNIAKILGLTDMKKLHEERFHVDRMKLEAMIKEEKSNELPSVFFNKIMEDTNTYIIWPDKIRTGTKSKKDPFVQISGRLNDVKVAKDKILQRLEPVNNRVTMKLDVSYTVHSHIIGLGGSSIKAVMEKTQCHIHFPDSNRSNSSEKSNQVSIVGELVGVEKARRAIRNLVPLVFCFEIPNISCLEPQPDINNPFVVCISQQYDVQVMFRNRSKFNAILVFVKGRETEVQKVKEATIRLINFFSEPVSNQDGDNKHQNIVQMAMEITPYHHPFVRGENNVYLKTIMQNTSTLISFPETNDSNIPMIKRSNVIIKGDIDSVYVARQQLIGSLPLVLIFDLPEKLGNIKSEKITELMSSLNIFINFRHKPKQTSYSVIIKGVERSASNIYEARRQILGLSEPEVVAKIPSSYHFSTSPTSTSDLPMLNNNLPATSTLINWNQLANGGKMSNSKNFVVPFKAEKKADRDMVPFQLQFPKYTLFPSSSSALQNVSASSNYSRPKSSASNHGLLNSDSGFISMNSSHTSISPIASPPSKSPVSSVLLDSYLSEREDKNFPTPVKPTPYPSRSLGRKQLLIAANQALQNPDLEKYRIPNPLWAGLGFSGTSPSALEKYSIKEQKKNTNNAEQSSNSPTSTTCINTSNFGEYLSNDTVHDLNAIKWNDLSSLLIKMDMDRYINVFTSHEIDLAIFKTLDDKDLVDIGITALGARRKILFIIAELTKNRIFHRAPGAERYQK